MTLHNPHYATMTYIITSHLTKKFNHIMASLVHLKYQIHKQSIKGGQQSSG
jgi:hypothetical protein